MKIAIIGLGYVGQVSAIALAAQGHSVLGIDIDKAKVEGLRKGVPTIHEPKLKELLAKNVSHISFSTSYEGLADSEVAIISVPTPTVNGKAELKYVKEACKSAIAVNSKIIVVIKSTVVPGTAKEIAKEIGIEVVSNPEFTQEGTALEDTLHPDRTVIGSVDSKAADIVERILEFTGAPVIKTTNENAEMIKYASNAFLATKISFINEIADLCEKIPGGDVEVVAKGMGLDKRIAPRFLKAGIGYGGSCLPKDTQALVSFAKENGVSMGIVNAAIDANNQRVKRTLAHISYHLNGKFRGAKVGVLGIAFKGGTNDIRESQALKIIEALKEEGAIVYAYDPVVKNEIEGVKLCGSIEEMVKNSDVVLVAAEWSEFEDLKAHLQDKPVVDARRVMNPKDYKNIRAIGLG